MIASMNCPSCGAPVRAVPGRDRVLCLYCSATLRLDAGPDRSGVAVEPGLPPEAVDRLKQLVLAGRHPDAVRAYEREAGATREEAEAFVQALVGQIGMQTLRGQMLSRVGVVIAGAALAVLVGSAAAGVTGRLHPAPAVGLAAFALLNLAVLAPGLRASLSMVGGHRAPARILRRAHIGEMPIRGRRVHVLRLLVEVRPEGAAPFQAELAVPARERSLAKSEPGDRIEVRYHPRDPERVYFRRALDPP